MDAPLPKDLPVIRQEGKDPQLELSMTHARFSPIYIGMHHIYDQEFKPSAVKMLRKFGPPLAIIPQR
ncbi:MAG: hypothetical protein KIT18_04835 [Burkholderiales bacterium]|nr:hypothetical protein [Burkholderiales bacterium]